MDRKPPRRITSIDGFIPTRKLSSKSISRVSLQRPDGRASVVPAVQRTQRPTALPTHKGQPTTDKATKPKSKKKLLKRAAMVMAVLVLVGGLFGLRLFANLSHAFHGNLFSDAKALVSTEKLKGEDQGRVNILLAGNSADDPGHDGAQLTDSIMILSLDTNNHTAMMLSIPRDTWVPIPSMGHQKINAANTVSDFSQAGYPSGGMGQLEQIISTNMGIPIQYYALINYTAFKDAVNAVGGIAVNIQSPDPRGLFDPNIEISDGGPLKMPNGNNSLNGQQALNLARARGDSYYSYGFPQSDFDRTEHQRQMLVALGVKSKTAGVVANPIKVNKLFAAIGKNVKTDLSFANVLRLNQLTKDIDLAHIKSLTIANDGDTELLTNYTAADGQAALIPVAGLDSFNRIEQYYQQLTSNNPVVKEGSTAVVLNGGDTTGLAHTTEQKLQSQGYNVLGIGTAGHTYSHSMIIDLSHGKMPNSLQALKKLAPTGTPVVTSAGSGQSAEANGYTADFVIVLGQNWPTN
ncbi:MAG: LCP family protein [Candidatus Saccharimonadales bacterium]